MKNLKFYVGNFSVIIFFVLLKTHRSLCIYWTKASKMYTFKHMQATHDSCTTQQKCTKASKYIELLTEWEHKTQCVQICSSICWCVHVNLSLVSLCVVSSSPGAVYLSIHSHADHRRLSRGGFMTKNSFPDTDLTSSCTEELLEKSSGTDWAWATVLKCSGVNRTKPVKNISRELDSKSL